MSKSQEKVHPNLPKLSNHHLNAYATTPASTRAYMSHAFVHPTTFPLQKHSA